jgi:tetratricopeptide (TPR) repeat protein
MPKHRHLTRQLLLAARRGHLPAPYYMELLLERLASACPACREVIESIEEDEIPPAAYRAPVARALGKIPVHPALEGYEAQRRAAPALFDQLAPLAAAQRLLLIRNAPERFGNLALGERALDAARACLPQDLPGSLAWAEAVEAIAGAYLAPYPAHLARAVALQANAHRALGDFARARTLFRRAQQLLDDHDVFELEVGAELNSLLASLHIDLGEWEEATHHLESAIALYQILGDTQALARTFMQLGNLQAHLGDPAAATQADRAACNLLDPETDTRLYLAARLNYAFHLQDLGESARARDVLAYERELFEASSDPLIATRVTWLLARLDVELGDPAEGERRYRELRDRFAAQEHGFHAALVCVELASLYLQQGRLAEVEEAAGQAVELFQAHALHQDALASLLLLRQAARARTLTLDALRRGATYLRRAQHEPKTRRDTAN